MEAGTAVRPGTQRRQSRHHANRGAASICSRRHREDCIQPLFITEEVAYRS